MVVAETRLRFRRPLRFDEEVELIARVTRLGETSMTTAVTVQSGGQPAAEIELRHVFVDATSRAKTSIPAPIRERLAAFA